MPLQSQTYALRGGQWKLVGQKVVFPQPQRPQQPHITSGGDISAGAGQHKAVQCTAGASAGISPFLVPLIELIDRAIAYVAPVELPGIAETIESYLANQISDDDARCLMRLNGVNWDVWYPWVHSRREMPSVDDFINVARREGLADDAILKGLRYYGFIEENEARYRLTAYDKLPALGQVLHFLQRNVFDDDYVRDFGLLEGFDTRFWPRYGNGLRAIGVMEQTARDEYAAHWINPSISQLADMVFRLRPDKPEVKHPFTEADFLRVLAEQDVAPYFRQRLLDISYRPLSIRYLQELATRGLLTLDDLKSRWRDLGFRPALADKLAQMSWWNAQRQRAIQQKGYTPAAVAKLWPAGQIKRADAYAALAPQGMSADDVDKLLDLSVKELNATIYQRHAIQSINAYASLAAKAYGDGVVTADTARAALVKAGYSTDAANLEIDTVTLRVRMGRIDAARKAVRKSYLRGEVNDSEAVAALTIVGVLPDTAVADVAGWKLELTVPRKSAATAQILKWTREGLLSIPAAQARLVNLGWNGPDIVLMIAEVEADIKKAAALADQKARAALDRASKLAASATTKITKAYCRQYPVGKLKLWYSERIVDDGFVTDTLGKCGYSPDAIADYLKEFGVAREAKDAKARKAGAAGVEYAGPGAAT